MKSHTLKGVTIVICSLLIMSCTNSLPVLITDRSINRTATPPSTTEATNPAVNQSPIVEGQSTPLADRDIHVERAEYYQNLANSGDTSQSKVESQLNAAENFIQAQDYYNAEQLASSLNTARLSKAESDRLAIVNSYIEYERNDYTKSLEILEPLIGHLIPKATDINTEIDPLLANDANQNVNILQSNLALNTQQIDALLLASFNHQMLGNNESAVATLLRRENALIGEARAETTRYIWQVIDAMLPNEREQLMQTTRNPLVRNRVEQSLDGQISQNDVAPTQFTQWRAEPATKEVQTHDVNWSVSSPKNIAVLLPLNSKFNKAAQALLDGVKYQNELNKSAFRPQIQVYDIGQNPYQTQQYYSAAIAAGADFVIGPLGTEYANQISSISGQRIPTILLGGNNAVGGSTVRFTMSPESQGVVIAERARRDGHTSAAILAPNTPTNERIINAFNDYWLQIGGKVSSVVNYNEQQFDHSTELKQLFNIIDSESRHREISDTLGFKPKFNASPRNDIDFILMLAGNESGRIVRPQINFFSGSKIPVYSTENIFNGIPNAIENTDLDNTLFPIMPWVYKSKESAPYAGQLNRLFAMGADAYAVAGSYSILRTDSSKAINANTGQVSINGNSEVRAQPLWAKFVNGEPQLVETLGIDVSPTGQFQPGLYGSGGSTRSTTGEGVYNDKTWDSGKSKRKTGS